MTTPPQDEPRLTQDAFCLPGEVVKAPCRYCGTLNLPGPIERADRFDCCSSEPVRVIPLTERSDASRASWLADLAYLAEERERFEARMHALHDTSSASVSGPRPWQAQ